MPSSDEQDLQDMKRLAAGHHGALDDLMDRHAEKIFHYLLRALQDEEEAADLAQETFAKVFQHRERFDLDRKFTTWLYTIAGNLARDRFRQRARRQLVSLDTGGHEDQEPLKETLPDTSPNPDEMLQKAERSEAVRKAISHLPEDLREALVLAVYEELPQAEIAEILNCTAKAVETRIYRARNLLRGKLSPLLGNP
jgi:RNA polymerase sigma-70 factor (ECF subfamily)